MKDIIITNNVSFFWKNIDNANFITKENFTDFEKKILIINLDSKRSLFYVNNKIHFYNGKIIVIPEEFDILRYDKYFSTIIGKISYDVIIDIFNIYNLEIKKEGEENKLDEIIDKLKKGKYGDIDSSNYWFMDAYPYIKCASFYCRDMSMPKENKKYIPNYGGRCIELLSDKKIIIGDVPIEQSLIHIEMERLKETNVAKVMITNGIPSNPSIRYNKKEKDPAQKDITNSWLS